MGTPSYTPEYSGENNYLIYDVDDYKYSSTRLQTPTGTKIQPFLQEGYRDTWGRYYYDGYHYYSQNGSLKKLDNNQDIYVIYEKEPSPTPGGKPAVPETLQWRDQETPASKPTLSKSSINNGDDTNTITLGVKAPEKEVSNFPKANVIVVLDLSASMSEWMDGQTRLNRAKTAVNNMAETLLSRKGTDGSSLVKMSLITFGAPVVTAQEFTDNITTFKNTVNGLQTFSGTNYYGGTNWEGALYEANRMANAEGDEDAATFVVFVTDGDPTFRKSRGELSDSQLESEQTTDALRLEAYKEGHLFGFGTTSDGFNGDRFKENFNSAVEQVKQIVKQDKYFYTIGISSDVTKVANLCTEAGVSDGHAFLGTNASGLTDAFNSVVESISATLGFGDVQINDGITALTNLKMKVL